mgnify:CR=1 FL=1
MANAKVIVCDDFNFEDALDVMEVKVIVWLTTPIKILKS